MGGGGEVKQRMVETGKKRNNIERDGKEQKYEYWPPSLSLWVILLQTCQNKEAQSAFEAVDEIG